MGRGLVVVVALLALCVAAVGPALADEKEPGALMGRAFQGSIKSISGNTWVIATDQYGDKTVDVGGAQAKWPGKGGKNGGKKGGAALTDFKAGNPGDRVVIKLEKRAADSGDTLRARQVQLIRGKSFSHFAGTVTAVSGDSITVGSATGEARTFGVSGSTAVGGGKRATTLSAAPVNVGDNVTLVVRVADNTVTALKVHKAGEDAEDNAD
jgi:hypothetical protein